MKNILAAIMLMGATVSVDAMMITEVIEVIEATNRYRVCNTQEIAKLNQMSNQESYGQEYLVLESTMMADAAYLCTLAMQYNTGSIVNEEQITAQGQEYTQRLVNSYYDCRDHLRSWQSASENNPSFKDKLRTFFGLRSRPAEIISIVKANLKAIKMGALNLRRDLPGGEFTSEEIAAAKADRELKKITSEIASYASDIQAVGAMLSRPFPWADKVSNKELEEELQNLIDKK